MKIQGLRSTVMLRRPAVSKFKLSCTQTGGTLILGGYECRLVFALKLCFERIKG